MRQTRFNVGFWTRLALLIGVNFAAYYPTLFNGFIWDDDRYIEQNVQLRTLGGLERIWLRPLTSEPQYYPLTHTTLWLEYHAWGARAGGYHLDNLLLHTASAVVLWQVLAELGVGGAWVAALIFAVHPLQVETVAWATERKNVLSGLLYFLSGWAYLRTRWGRQLTGRAEGRGSGGWYAASLILFVGALLAKSVASTMPAAILVLCWWKRGRIRMVDVWPLVPMFFAGVAMGSLTGWMERHVVGAIGPAFDFLTPVDRFCIAGRAFWFYLVKLVWPWPMIFIFPHWQVDPAVRMWWMLFPIAAAGILLAMVLLSRRIGRGPAAAGLFFAGTLFPALGFVNVFPMRFSYVADHFQYIACVGPIVLAVEGVRRLARRREVRVTMASEPSLMAAARPLPSPGTPGEGQGEGFPLTANAIRPSKDPHPDPLLFEPEPQSRRPEYRARGKESYSTALAMASTGVVWVMVLCAASNARVRAFRDRLTLWADTVAKNPGSGMARNNYGSALGAIGENEAAKAQYREAIRLDGDGDGGDWVGLGQCFAREGDFETARDMYLKAIALVPGSDEPVFRRMLAGREFELGTAYEGLTREFPTMVADYRADALGAYRRAIELYPEYEDPRVNLSMLLHDAGRDEEAIEQCRAILAYDPESVAAHTNLGQIFYFEGKLDESLAEYRAVLKIDGENVGAMASAAAILAQQGQVDEAIDMLKKAHAIDPENALVNQDLAAAMAMKNGAGR